MSEVAGVKISELPKNEFIFKNEDGVIEISSPFVALSSEGKPLRFSITLEKVPTRIEEGLMLNGVIIDRGDPKLQTMLKQARTLKKLPVHERPRKILELLRSNVRYAYNEVINELTATNPELAKWVSENTGLESDSAKPVKLSEMIASGYGICRHLAVTMLVLGKEAGMEGSYQSYGTSFVRETDQESALRNIIRRDNNEPLFKMVKVGDLLYGGHAWVEFATGTGEWIPVDPSTQLIGDTPQGEATFRDANYRSSISGSLEIEGFPGHVNHLGNGDLWFLPGEARHTGTIEINSREKTKPLVVGNSASANAKQAEYDKQTWPQPTSYQGTLNFTISSHASNRTMTVGVVNAKVGN